MAIIEEIFEDEEDQITKVDSLKKEGNNFFANGEFEKANEKYQEAIASCPPTSTEVQSILLSNSAAALIKLRKWESAVEAASKSIEIGATNEKALERRAFAYSNMSEKYENSIEDYKQLQESLPKRRVELDRKIAEINEKINNRNEAMKADVMEKLKGFGNFCLSPFGLSTDSFEMVPNGNGGFSVQMKGATNKQEGASQEKKEEENA
ncbi:TPR_REGION domain-containing protein [Caenorhabditis elegans]|uniref:TPR_REGION domain-containing protein n=1 Tax=Caenorhabditis elegans TaxID=6239 RepID=O44951_CAEEL|nr:TPR_REGION domain-containing protein [Caenorhabditis elegans]CCD62123.1 TPR_REGION domain-containing protein [Caenorhabditis elegans]|eukprot:NP_492795.1 TeTratriCopeptide repeat domain protein related [Caenorhabditis elegans]